MEEEEEEVVAFGLVEVNKSRKFRYMSRVWLPWWLGVKAFKPRFPENSLFVDFIYSNC